MECFGSHSFLRARFARLDATGAPDEGTGNLYVARAISLAVQPQYRDGSVLTQELGDGTECVRAQGDDEIIGYNGTLTICGPNPGLAEFLAGGTLYRDGTGANAPVLGYAMPGKGDPVPAVSVEGWTYAWDGEEQAVDGTSLVFWRYVVPHAKFRIGDFTLNRSVLNVPLPFKGRQNLSLGTGPGGDLPASIAEAGTLAWFQEPLENGTDDLPDEVCASATLTIP
ncbi:MAG TPA: hypothetical protein VGB14_16330 [Acidimicrobiales bacterium]|jgi:hypothetical protein